MSGRTCSTSQATERRLRVGGIDPVAERRDGRPVGEVIVEFRLLGWLSIKIERWLIVRATGEDGDHEAAVGLVVAGVVQPGIRGLGDGVVERTSDLLHAFGVHAG